MFAFLSLRRAGVHFVDHCRFFYFVSIFLFYSLMAATLAGSTAREIIILTDPLFIKAGTLKKIKENKKKTRGTIKRICRRDFPC